MTREQFEELLKDLNETRIYSFYDYSFSKVIAEHDANYEVIEKNRDIDKHRWYENSEIIIKVGDWYMGIYGPTNSYSEMATWEDISQETSFYEVKKIEKTTYDYVYLTNE